jgi:hypothetical protein
MATLANGGAYPRGGLATPTATALQRQGSGESQVSMAPANQRVSTTTTSVGGVRTIKGTSSGAGAPVVVVSHAGVIRPHMRAPSADSASGGAVLLHGVGRAESWLTAPEGQVGAGPGAAAAAGAGAHTEADAVYSRTDSDAAAELPNAPYSPPTPVARLDLASDAAAAEAESARLLRAVSSSSPREEAAAASGSSSTPVAAPLSPARLAVSLATKPSSRAPANAHRASLDL